MIKRALSVIVSATLALSLSPLSAFAAQPAQTSDTFHYVALGDSIASGYGITEGASLTQDPALVLRTEKDGVADEVASAEDGHTLIPVKTAYPYLFYQNTLLQKGAAAGMDVNLANLASVAFRASDVRDTILTTSNDPNDYAAEAAYILEKFVAEGSSVLLSNHPTLYKKYLSEADLVSIQLGGNDMIMGAIGEMKAQNNPVLNNIVLSLDLVLFGYDVDQAVLYGISQLVQADVTLDDVIEAAEFLNTDNLSAVAARSEQEAIDGVTDVLDAVEEVGKSDVQIALLNMFNPYGNSLEYSASTSKYAEVASKLIKATLAKVTSDLDLSLAGYDETPQAVAEAESDLTVTTEEAADIADEMQGEASSARESSAALSEIASELGVSSDTLTSMSESAVTLAALKSGLNLPNAKEIAAKVTSLKEAVAEALSVIKKEIAYPIQYLLVGRTVDANVQEINADLAELASERDNVTLVDVYDIPNECNTDPHPDVQGHEAIAETMGDQLQDLLDSLMPAKSETVAESSADNGDAAESLGAADTSKTAESATSGTYSERSLKGLVASANAWYTRAQTNTTHTLFGASFSCGSTIRFCPDALSRLLWRCLS